MTRQEIEQQIYALEHRGSFTGLLLGGTSHFPAHVAVRFVQTAPVGYIPEAAKQVDAMLAAERQSEQLKDKMHAFDVAAYRRESPMSVEEQEAIDEDLERARQIAEQQNSTEARLARVEGVLCEIRDLLAKR